MMTDGFFTSDIFDRQSRRAKRHKLARAPGEDRWLIHFIAQELLARFDDTNHLVERVLLIGNDDGVILDAFKQKEATLIHADLARAPLAGTRFVQCEEDMLPFADDSFDAVFAIGTLDSVNDLPGALALIRRALRPGGILLAGFLGVGSLARLKEIVMPPGVSISRMHPLIDVRGAGDLLARAGFANPVADMDVVTARYSSFRRLLNDIGANGLGNSLKLRAALSRPRLAHWQDRFDAMKEEDGKVSETFAPVFMTGIAARAF
jgi:NADH dehydrogenase [ubiquinone] 1 alpha subcomplex assembly factor 5